MLIYLSIPITLALLGFLYFLGLKLIQDRVGTLYALSSHFSGHISWYTKIFHKTLSFVGYFSGHRFTFTFGAAHSIIIEYFVHSKSKLRIYMYRSNPGPVLFAKKIDPHDADLYKYFIYSNMPSEAIQYFNDISRKSAIKQLLETGWEPPIITSNKIIVEAKNVTTDIAPQLLEAMLKLLIVLRN